MIEFCNFVKYIALFGNILKRIIIFMLFKMGAELMKASVSESMILYFKLKSVEEKINSLCFYMSTVEDFEEPIKALQLFLLKVKSLTKHSKEGKIIEISLIDEILSDWTKNITNKIAPEPESIFICLGP